MRILTLVITIVFSLCSSLAFAGNAILAAGAGYRATVDDLVQAYQAETGKKVDVIYGNMARVIAQAQAGGKADLVFGAKWFFDKAGLTKDPLVMGTGKLVLIRAKGVDVDTATGNRGLLNPKVKRVAMPDPKRAIYGRAAEQYLKNTGLYDKIKDKLLVVATVPQVGTYVMSGEADMGFVNLSHGGRIEPKVGGITILKKDYETIEIVLCRTSTPDSDAVKSLSEFMHSAKAKEIAKKHGL